MVSLEDEFEQYKALHKYSILKAMVIDYFQTLEQGEVNIPDFQRDDSPEKKAEKELAKLAIADINRFNSLYEEAWCILAPILD